MKTHFLFAWAALGCAMTGCGALAQDVALHVLRTGGGDPLSSGSVVVAPFPTTGAATLEFEFGFGTEESPTPGELHDSFTASLESGSGAAVFVVTTDVFGSQWVPSNPGGPELSASSVSSSTILPPIIVAPAGLVGAYRVRVELPEAFRAQPLTLHFDLFDNGDSLASVGFYNNVVSVPEPPMVAVAALGAALLASASWRRRAVRRVPLS